MKADPYQTLPGNFKNDKYEKKWTFYMLILDAKLNSEKKKYTV